MPGLRIARNSFDLFSLSAAPSRRMRIDVVAVACAIITVCGLVAYAAALTFLAEALL